MLAPSTVTPADLSVAPSKPKENYLTHESGILSWFLTIDHKRIGVMYLIGVLCAFALGGFFALALRLELFMPGKMIMSHDQYNQAMTLHGAVMVFLVVIPGIPAALGNFALPLQLGAKNVAFPRLNLMSYHLWLLGAFFFISSLLISVVDIRWTFYLLDGTTTPTAVIMAAFGAFILGFSSIFTGLNFIVTVHKLRPPGMTWFRLPLFVWALYSAAIIQLLATPVISITLLMLIAERVVGIGIFDPAFGGDPVLFQDFFWFYSHPAVYVMIVPAFGVVSEIISAFSRKQAFGYKFIAMSSVAIALLGFLVWGHHMFTSGQSMLAGTIFSAITYLIAIPTVIIVCNWIATLYKGRIHLDTPMLYALAFLWVFTIAGMAGLFLSAMSVDVHLHDTYFVVAHFHYVMMGGAVTAFLGGLHYWWPKITGKMYNEKQGRISALFVFVGLNATFLPQFVMGARGMPRRYYDYLPEFQQLHQVSSIGAFIMGTGFLITAYYLLVSLKKGKKAAANPWGASTLEWMCSSPPPYYNFHEAPLVKRGPYEGYEQLCWDKETQGYRPAE